MDTDDAEPTSASAAAPAAAAAAAAAGASRNAIAAADTAAADAAADGGGEADDESGSSDDDAASDDDDDDGPDADAAHAEFEFESDGEDGRPKRIIPGVIRDGDDSSEWSSSSDSETEKLDLNNMPKWLDAGPCTRPRSPSMYCFPGASSTATPGAAAGSVRCLTLTAWLWRVAPNYVISDTSVWYRYSMEVR
jgi:hypothetical protein